MDPIDDFEEVDEGEGGQPKFAIHNIELRIGKPNHSKCSVVFFDKTVAVRIESTITQDNEKIPHLLTSRGFLNRFTKERNSYGMDLGTLRTYLAPFVRRIAVHVTHTLDVFNAPEMANVRNTVKGAIRNMGMRNIASFSIRAASPMWNAANNRFSLDKALIYLAFDEFAVTFVKKGTLQFFYPIENILPEAINLAGWQVEAYLPSTIKRLMPY